MKRDVVIRFGAVILGSLFTLATASELRVISVEKAQKLAESIPVAEPLSQTLNVAQRINSIGLQVQGGRIYSYDSKSELEQPSDRVGDVHFTIHTGTPSEQFKRKTCDMSGDPSFIKRDNKFYPESRSANWLMYGVCSTQFPMPK